MADFGRIERVMILRHRGTGNLALRLPNHPETKEAEWERVEYIPESDHYSEIERLAGELEARADELDQTQGAADSPTPPTELNRAEAHGLREAASFLRDSVPTSLTRGERE